ncbi:MAG: nucleotidyltransferase [Bacteroidetes bacterium]|nr:nucleotidyltransferase [Bacteroidota bacterium]
MANCNNLFIKFNGELSITSTKKAKLITSRDTLRDLIRKHFKENHPEYVPKFRGQGSYDLGTMIRTKEDTCDLDNGVYFFPKPKETGTTMQNWVWDAVENATNEKPQHRKKCVRVIYQGDYHIDLPVYYKESEKNNDENPHLAVKDDDWQKSDPKEFKDWFTENKDDKGQLIRIVKYLKAWCDNRTKKMPTGLAMTVLASNNIKYNDRDDICLRDTLKAIERILKFNWSCVMPTTPKDDLFENYSGDKDYFFESLKDFIADTNKAIDEEKNQLKASRLWRKHLGSYFPEGEDADVDRKLESLQNTASTILTGVAKTDMYGNIQEKTGVKNLPHKNYGGN